MGYYPIIEFLIHEEPDRSQPVQFGPDLCQETTLLARHQNTDCSNHPKAQRSSKPPRGLFIENKQRGSEFQTQTDDLAFSRTNGSGHRAWLKGVCQFPDRYPYGKLRDRWFHFPRDGRRNGDARVKPAEQIDLANLSQRD